MSRRKRSALPASVWRLGERIEQWRRTRVRQTAMAPELWSAAVVLAQSHGAYRVARALRIDFGCLKRRMAEAVAVAPPPRAASGAFVEWTGAQILSASSARGPIIELSDETGVRLTLRFSADVEVDVARVVAAFRQRVA
jgi:hypothetical protein